MENLILVGSGGCMRELLFQIEELNKEIPTWSVKGFVDEYYTGEDSNVKRIEMRCPYLGKDDVLLKAAEPVNVAVCVGEPWLRKKIVSKLKKNEMINFPNLILSDVKIAEDVFMGEGCIISMDSIISTGVSLGDFVFLNMGTKICHEGSIGNFVTLSPKAALAGNVTVGDETEIGMNAAVIQGITIGAQSKVGAGAVVVKDVRENITVVGVPAKCTNIDKVQGG